MQNKRDIEIMIGVLLIMSTVTAIVTLLPYNDTATNALYLLAIHVFISTGSLITAYLLRKSNIAPKYISTLGVIGGLMTLLRGVLIVLGFDKLSWGVMLVFPLIGYKISLAVQLLTRGFIEKIQPLPKQNLFRLADKDRSDQ